jgi:glycosyltransferase involved in cell wall biosynthesis
MTCPISVVVLTYNEEKNLPILLRSLEGWVQEICIVDSGSTDQTLDIAASFGAQVLTHPWRTHADQFNWGLQHFDFKSDWIMRMDADERVMPELALELRTVLPTLTEDVTGLYVKRRVYFMGRWIRHGAYYPTWLLRVFRKGKAFCENRWMDEHLVLTEGTAQRLKHDIIDENRNGLRYFTLKHESYAEREMMDMLNLRPQAQSGEVQGALLGQQDEQKRWLKGNVYARSPLFWRALLYFLYRYIIRLGFLDGREGLIFHVLQGFWYRFYVDAKIWDHQRQISLSAFNQQGDSV